MKSIVIKILLVFCLCNTAFSQGLPLEISASNGMLAFQYADSSYNFYNPCNVTRIQTFERYPDIVWVYIVEDETVRIEKIDVTFLDSPSSNTALQIVNFIANILGNCFTSDLYISEKYYNGWITSSGVWKTSNKTWLTN